MLDEFPMFLSKMLTTSLLVEQMQKYLQWGKRKMKRKKLQAIHTKIIFSFLLNLGDHIHAMNTLSEQAILKALYLHFCFNSSFLKQDIFIESLQETNSLMFFVAPCHQSAFETKGYLEVWCHKIKVRA